MSQRRPPQPSAVGDDPCFNCGKPGSTCQDCGCYICDACNTNSNAPTGHEPQAHLEPAPIIPETELETLVREHRELTAALAGSVEDRLRQKNADLRARLATRNAQTPASADES